ncbi:MAG TPA: methyltransferase [Gemmataceae bacterium]|nr:methyltransferase [Gemmataceae bacterium]
MASYPPIIAESSPAQELSQAAARYQCGESRKIVFFDLVLESVRKWPLTTATVLDIGCGHGFDGDAGLQQSIAEEASRFIGIEPAKDVPLPAFLTDLHPCTFEEARLQPDSVHVAYSAFVLEHVEHPSVFWEKLYQCLVPGGVFWGFTVDGRHLFSIASQMTGALKFKDAYLNWLRGRRGVDRYENYRTFYRANTPAGISRHTRAFRRADYLSVHRVGQLNYYFPRRLWPVLHWMERLSMRLRLPGSILIVRLEK